jgi:hypothetical protein
MGGIGVDDRRSQFIWKFSLSQNLWVFRDTASQALAGRQLLIPPNPAKSGKDFTRPDSILFLGGFDRAGIWDTRDGTCVLSPPALNISGNTPKNIPEDASIVSGGNQGIIISRTAGIDNTYVVTSICYNTSETFTTHTSDPFTIKSGLSHAGCAYLGRSVYCFGGYHAFDDTSSTSPSSSSPTFPLSSVPSSDLVEIRLNNSLFPCSPHTFLNSSSGFCQICAERQTTSAWNVSKPESCPQGKYLK